ncbi:MAG: TonB family protein [Rhodothermales bacterium]
MSKNDWIGAGTSAAVHVLLLLVLLSLTTASEPLTAGYVEVEFGTFSQGRAVQRATKLPEKETKDELRPDAENKQQPVPDKKVESKPVDLPDQPVVPDDPERIQSPDVDEVSPETPVKKPNPVQEDVISGGPTKAVAGQEDGSHGRETGTEGPGLDEHKAAPYVLEGIDRLPLRTQLPDYDEKVNAVIQVRITVDPRGRIVRVLPLRKGNPTLEQAVMQALRQWLFNPLEAAAPQENQTGTITFRFRLE